MNLRFLNALFWGNSVALSWMWGLGLFFSVQITFMFGLQGLLLFAIPNALGLILFGYLTDKVAKNQKGGNESLALFFEKYAKPFHFAFYLYQIVALALTVFALTQYLFGTLQLVDTQLNNLYLPLVVFVLLAAGCLFGEELGIKKIKYGHAFAGILLVVAIGIILASLKQSPPLSGGSALPVQADGQPAGGGPSLLGYTIPLLVGLLVGPWLDLQHWQRAIQIHREKTSVSGSYLIGGILFFLFLIFHGFFTTTVLSSFSGSQLSSLISPDNLYRGLDGFTYVHQIGVEFAKSLQGTGSWLPPAYFAFLFLCAITTIDSGYVALKWFHGSTLAKSDNMLLGMLPKAALESPITSFLVVGIVALAGIAANLQLEYYMVMYASFFVGYAVLAIGRCVVPNANHPLPQVRLASTALISVAIFALGYFNVSTPLLALATLLPIAHVIWLAYADKVLTSAKAKEISEDSPSAAAKPIIAPVATQAPLVVPPVDTALHGGSDAHRIQGHFEGKWFVYSMMASYSDTNSVGNVYFGMYAMFVGKARELFFNTVMPDFNLKTTSFYILTRSFEHKFIREAREFDIITVKIRVSETNRKFCTLEHQILGPNGEILGKGKQSLLFVSSKDYGLIDIPTEVLTAFMPHI